MSKCRGKAYYPPLVIPSEASDAGSPRGKCHTDSTLCLSYVSGNTSWTHPKYHRRNFQTDRADHESALYDSRQAAVWNSRGITRRCRHSIARKEKGTRNAKQICRVSVCFADGFEGKQGVGLVPTEQQNAENNVVAITKREICRTFTASLVTAGTFFISIIVNGGPSSAC